MHLSVPVQNTTQIIESTKVSPLVSRCKVKVLYVGEEPNRNRSVITREVAEEIGKNLPGSPIVGYYNKSQDDFEQHNRDLDYDEKTCEYKVIDTTKAYGFVPTDAKVWFQDFLDDNQITRTYLCTEGIIWTSAYPESQRIIDTGNNQSMELSDKNFDGVWAEDEKTGRRFFIINEALVEKLCILGQDVEPCFEGCQITKDFSLHEELKELRQSLFAMLKEGGNIQMDEQNMNPEVEEKVEPETETSFKTSIGSPLLVASPPSTLTVAVPKVTTL